MSQPKWTLVANIGDVNPFEHGGGLVFKDRTRVYTPELEIIEPDPDNEKLCFVTRVIMDKLEDPNDEWFAENGKIDHLANFSGMQPDELELMFKSDDLVARAIAYEAVYSYYGGQGSTEIEEISEIKRRHGAKVRRLNNKMRGGVAMVKERFTGLAGEVFGVLNYHDKDSRWLDDNLRLADKVQKLENEVIDLRKKLDLLGGDD